MLEIGLQDEGILLPETSLIPHRLQIVVWTVRPQSTLLSVGGVVGACIVNGS